MTSAIRDVDGGVEIAVHVQPRASQSRVIGMHGDRLKIALAAPPVDGAANAALLELIADLLEVPRRHVELVRGESSRQKTVRVVGISAAWSRERLLA